MALAIDIMHGHGPSNEMHPQLQHKKTKIRLYGLLLKQQKVSYALCITNKTALSIDIMHGCGLRKKMCPQLQPKKTQVRPY